MFILKAIKSHFIGLYDKQGITVMVISSETYERFINTGII